LDWKSNCTFAKCGYRSIHPPFENGCTRREYTPEGAGQSPIDRNEMGILLFPTDKPEYPAGPEEWLKIIE